MRLGLAPMRAACVRLGSPECSFEAVHVAGTNGKGSVCAMVEAALRAEGQRTGLYTSPHLCRFAERIRVDGEPLDDVALARVLRRALDDGPELSFFETATLAAFLTFREAKVDTAVIEVGIGGRLDATNVLAAPRAAAVTRVALDHTDRLGGTLEAIAREKAAIAKPGTTLVLGAMSQGARTTACEVAQQAGAVVVDAESDLAANAFAGSVTPKLAGDHQRGNARVAYLLAKLAGARETSIRYGVSTAVWHGRLEWVATERGPVLLDGAHNPDGAEALAAYLSTLWGSGSGGESHVLVFGALADKAWGAMLDTLAPIVSHRIYVAPSGRAPMEPEVLATRWPGETAASVSEALERARGRAGRGGLVVVCGSLYLVGEARAELLGVPRDPHVAL